MGFLNNLINGISLGSIYAVIALGYTLVYGIAKMLNFCLLYTSDAADEL